jgi:GNAT superfamily N-acetyltransferase
MSANVSVRRVASPDDEKVFIRFPWKVYAGDPNWVPPLVSQRKDKLDRQHNPMLKHMDLEYFIAWRGAEPVGTIAAFINHAHNEFHKENIGWFGMFEVLNDQEAANALLQTAEEWVKAKGAKGMRGPASYNDLDEFGLQVDYFGDPHVLLMPYNPPYYKTFIEEAGYTGMMDTVSYRIAAESMRGENAPEKIRRVLEKQRKRRKVEIRVIDMKRFEDEVRDLMKLYIASWADNWGFVPPTEEEMFHVINQLKQFVEPEFIRIAEIEGEPVGFIVLFPDLNQAIKYAHPSPNVPEFITLLRILWHWKIQPKMNRVRVPFLGVLPEYRGMAIDAMLYMAVVDSAIERGYTEGDFGWILDNNQAMNQIADLVKGEVYKRFRLYNKEFAPAEAASSAEAG